MGNIARGILISIAFVLVCWWVLQGSPSFQSCIQQDQTQVANSQPDDYVSAFVRTAGVYRGCLGDFVHDRKDEILVAFTVILAFSTIFLWVATRDLVKGAERTSQSQLRAYVAVPNTDIGKVSVGEKPLASVRLANFGQTPAYALHHMVEMAIADKGTKTFRLNRRKKSGKTTLNPTESFSVRSAMTEALTEEQHAAIMNDTKRIFLFGEIHYRDAFWRSRKTFFRFETAGPSLIAEGLLSVSAEGNSAT
ncbi:hypothetical protein ACFSOZ_29305 [Mesorhizobium newzealandense]|uniref:Uncharacterized protein n=1 Tax=Mesorhizobium newzealandense TaxID=1300302 RepID=A0ABW4UHH3_9HYPH